MNQFTGAELQEALRAITSALGKSEKAQHKLKTGTFQYRLTAQGIKAYQMAICLIERSLGAAAATGEATPVYADAELAEARAFFASAAGRVEKVLPKFAAGTSQHTLATRRIKAFQLASALIEKHPAAAQ